MTNRSLEDVALQIFGSKDNPAYEKWITYWNESRRRNRGLLERFEEIVLTDFSEKRVLDVGCGTGGLAEIIASQCEAYCGIDYNWHVLRFVVPGPHRQFLQCNAPRLPFSDRSFDFVFAFDVIEHLGSGEVQQAQFLAEVRRVLSPLGMVFLTTPNFWYPYDAHSDLYFPQYLPASVQDQYVGWRNPGFLQEHESFDTIQLMKPHHLRSMVRDCGLRPLHDLPCCLDLHEYRKSHPFLSPLAYLGLGWYLHAEFWTILVHEAEWSKLRLKLRNSWYYERNQPDEGDCLKDFASLIDFNQSMFNQQLGTGWHWYERDDRQGFRWIKKKAVCYLQSYSEVRYIHLSGYSHMQNRVHVKVDGVRVGEHHVPSASGFDLKFFLPFSDTSDRIFEVVIESARAERPQNSVDKRKLSFMIFSVKVTP